MRLKFRKGLDIAIPGAPRQEIGGAVTVNRVGIIGSDYGPARFDILVSTGDTVGRGTPLLRDRARPGIVVTSPASGIIEDIAIGAKRRLSTLVIAVEGEAAISFDTAHARTPENARELLLETGLWTALQARPFDRIPDPDTIPVALFVTAMDTRPHAVDASVVIERSAEDFSLGVSLLATLAPVPVYICYAGNVPASVATGQIRPVEVDGRHPAGLPGTHIHHIAPASRNGAVWHIHYQDVVAIGHLLRMGTLPATRIIALSGSGVADPRLVEIPAGADLFELARAGAVPGEKHVLSGSALDGRESRFLSRYHWQATVLKTSKERATSNWLVAALRRAAAPAPLIPTRALDLASGTRLPLVALLRAISTADTEGAEKLGVLELAEDDLALATYVTGGSTSFSALLRRTLDTLEAE
ncbi:hypothetical protein [Pelagibacterium halotolerans]|uniref:hypothetical protein n=1 Tax=Pelagibacterium halotolerans TaxID=531813 RepID=UPI0038516A16